MDPKKTGEAYDQITHLWESKDFDRRNGIDAHKRALSFLTNRGKALDVGCGCTGRFTELLLSEGLTPECVDISEKMIRLARARHPTIVHHHQDICEWPVPKQYDFITAWDSIWHIPLSRQKDVFEKLVSSLNPGGVLIFTFGGTDQAGEHTDNFMGPDVYYSSLGTNGFLELLINLGCICKHLENDQNPQLHTYLIVQKPV